MDGSQKWKRNGKERESETDIKRDGGRQNE